VKLPAEHPLHLVIGLTIWSAFFIAAYGGLSVYCSAATETDVGGLKNPLNLGLLALTAGTSVVLGILANWCWRSAKKFPGKVSAGVYIAAVIATIGVGMPIIFLPPCI
jgi:hypothetical protein